MDQDPAKKEPEKVKSASRIFACRIPGAMHVFHGTPIDKENSKYPDIKGKTIHFTNGWYETSHEGEILELDALTRDKFNQQVFKPDHEERLVEELEKQRAGIINADPLMGSFADLVNRVVTKQIAGSSLTVPKELTAVPHVRSETDDALRAAIKNSTGGRA